MSLQDYTPKDAPKKGAHLYKHGLCGHPLYKRWRGMMQRCYDKNSKAFYRYGGIGIEVCERWHEFPNFLADMGMPPPGMSLDRIDASKGYSPNNCKWATQSEQMSHTNQSILITFNGVTKCLAHWAKDLQINVETLKYRIEAKWPIDKAMSSNKYSTNGKEICNG